MRKNDTFFKKKIKQQFISQCQYIKYELFKKLKLNNSYSFMKTKIGLMNEVWSKIYCFPMKEHRKNDYYKIEGKLMEWKQQKINKLIYIKRRYADNKEFKELVLNKLNDLAALYLQQFKKEFYPIRQAKLNKSPIYELIQSEQEKLQQLFSNPFSRGAKQLIPIRDLFINLNKAKNVPTHIVFLYEASTPMKPRWDNISSAWRSVMSQLKKSKSIHQAKRSTIVSGYYCSIHQEGVSPEDATFPPPLIFQICPYVHMFSYAYQLGKKHIKGSNMKLIFVTCGEGDGRYPTVPISQLKMLQLNYPNQIEITFFLMMKNQHILSKICRQINAKKLYPSDIKQFEVLLLKEMIE